MPDLAAERRDLAKADLNIAERERRVTRQIVLIEALRRGGHDLTEAERLLRTLQETPAAWYDHRDEIPRALARHDVLHERQRDGLSEGEGACRRERGRLFLNGN